MPLEQLVYGEPHNIYEITANPQTVTIELIGDNKSLHQTITTKRGLWKLLPSNYGKDKGESRHQGLTRLVLATIN